MELLGVIKGLSFVLTKGYTEAIVYSDSAYVINALTKGWAKMWASLGWKKKDGSIVKNMDLWQELLEVLDQFETVDFVKVKGHNGELYNEIADRYAKEAARKTAL